MSLRLGPSDSQRVPEALSMKGKWMTQTTRLAGAALVALTMAGLAACGDDAKGEVRAQDEKVWTVPATFTDCDAPDIKPGCVGEGEEGEYTGLEASDVTKPWRICATVPHLKD